MLSVKLDHKPPVEHPPVESGLDLTPVSPEIIEEVLNKESDLNVRSEELSLAYDLSSIITRVEALDKTDERIKAIGKLKGALELLS